MKAFLLFLLIVVVGIIGIYKTITDATFLPFPYFRKPAITVTGYSFAGENKPDTANSKSALWVRIAGEEMICISRSEWEKDRKLLDKIIELSNPKR